MITALCYLRLVDVKRRRFSRRRVSISSEGSKGNRILAGHCLSDIFNIDLRDLRFVGEEFFFSNSTGIGPDGTTSSRNPCIKHDPSAMCLCIWNSGREHTSLTANKIVQGLVVSPGRLIEVTLGCMSRVSLGLGGKREPSLTRVTLEFETLHTGLRSPQIQRTIRASFLRRLSWDYGGITSDRSGGKKIHVPSAWSLEREAQGRM